MPQARLARRPRPPAAWSQRSGPSNTGLPTISGTPRAGQPLSAQPGAWAGTAPLAYSYQWESCSALGQACAAISGATSATYTPSSGDVGDTLVVAVTAANAAGAASSSSYASVPVAAAETLAPPVSTVAPTIIGVAQSGETLYADRGTWSSAMPPAYAYQWQRCDQQGDPCTPIPGATGQTYQLSAQDTNNTITLTVTAANAAGSSSATSAATGVVAAAPPANLIPPAITGTPAVGQTLSVSDGTWASQIPLSVSYQWESCDPTGVTCVIIPGANNDTYTLGQEDATSTLAAIVTATNSSGSASYTATLGVLISGGAVAGPVLQAPPSVTGTATDGQMLTADPGQWSDVNSISYAYQWETCDAQGSNCIPIPGETTSTYVTSDDDVGNTILVVVTATAADGSTQAASSATATIAATSPTLISSPSIAGTAQAGQPLYVNPGDWNGTDLSYSVQWQRCDVNGANCQSIVGATDFEYDLSAVDVGTTLTAVVTASNSLGSVTAAAAPTAVVAVAPTVSETAAPSISGVGASGQTLTANPGTWTGEGDISYAYQWESCDTMGGNCVLIAGATSSTYTLSDSDVATTVAVSVTATDTNGSLTDISPATQPIAPSDGPISTAAPAITGTPQAGSTLSASTGAWSGAAISTFAYQWESCDASGGNCAPISGATSSTYVPTLSDVGTTIAVVVTAAAAASSVNAYSVPVGPVTTVSLANVGLPQISGSPQQGQLLTATPGEWSSSVPLLYAYQWEICDDAGQNCTAVPGQTSAAYTPAAAAVDTTIRVAVTAEALFGDQPLASEVVESDPSSVVAPPPPPPTDQAAPAISGDPIVGEQQTVDPGTWAGGQPINFSYQWQDCDQNGDPCTDIAGATSSSYIPTELDLDDQLAVVVTATNASGAATATAYTPSVITDVTPVDVAGPSISGDPLVGQTLTAAIGTWQGLPPITFTYQWQDCDENYDCTDIPGATGLTYTPTQADVGQLLAFTVTGTNAEGSWTDFAFADDVVNAPVAPTDSPPVISGTPLDGDTLTATPGQWAGAGPITYTYQWQRCDSSGQNCSPIPGATNSQYILSDDDLSSTVTVAVTATNPYGDTASQATPTPVITAGPPVASTPMVQGATVPGGVLTVGGLAATGAGPITTAVQWQDCNRTLLTCTNIPGATATTYTATESDVGYTVAAQVTYTNGAGATTVSAGAALPIADSAPVRPAGGVTLNETDAQVGDNLTTAGAWEGSTPMTFSYAWEVCQTPSGGGCGFDSSASTYQTQTTDEGRFVSALVTATNTRGSVTVRSAAAYVEDPTGAPVLDSLPAITGIDEDGQTLNASTGSWYEQPTTYSYQWQACVQYGYLDCNPIPGATSATLQLTSYQVEEQIEVVVTASNANGTATVTSAATPAVEGMPPVASAAPAVDGTPVVGNELSTDGGAWVGIESVFARPLAYAWQLCDSSGANCTAAPGTTDSPDYTPVPSQIGDTLRVAVTASSPDGRYSTTATSEATAAIGPATPPANTGAPDISGTPQDTEELAATTGTWAGDPVITYEYQWQRCDPAGANCQPIPNTNGADYFATSQDIGHTLTVAVTASNGGGGATETASPTATVQPAPPPIALFAPGISSAGNALSGVSDDFPEVGSQLQAHGDFSGDPATSTYSYQWLDCDPQLDDPSSGNPVCVTIPGATTASYTVEPPDFGYDIEVTMTASSANGSATATSDPTSPVDDGEAVGDPDYEGPAVAGATVVAQPNITHESAPVRSMTTYAFSIYSDEGWVLAQQGTDPTFTIPAAAVGQPLQITAKTTFQRTDGQPTSVSGRGPVLTQSTQTPAIEQAPIPAIAGTSTVAGNTYTATPGTWPGDGSVPIAYQWQDCDPNGEGCTNIANATGPTYTTAASDVGQGLRVVVTAGTGIATASSASALTAPIVAAGAAENGEPPQISGAPVALQTVTAAPGTWSGDSPITYSYQWQSCDAQGANCADIAGAIDSSYVLQDTDVGNTVRVAVTATNGAGAVTNTSTATGVVLAEPPPQNTQLPDLAILGPTTDAATFSTDGGQWAHLPDGAVPAGLQYQWQTCAADGTDCGDIPGQTAQDFDATSAQLEHRVRVVVTGLTDSGSATVASPLSPPLQPSTGSLTGKLVYVDAAGTGLYAADADGNNPTEISDCTVLMLMGLGSPTAGGPDCRFSHPAVSPNGQMVAVSVTPATGGACDQDSCSVTSDAIFTMNLDGTDAQRLPFAGNNPTWAPDGTALLYTGSAGGGGSATQLFTTYLADPQATNVAVPLPAGTTSADTGAYSPDGGTLAYSALVAGTQAWSVYTANSDGTDAAVLPGQPLSYQPQAPVFTPDSANVAYSGPAGAEDAYAKTFPGAYEQAIDPSGPVPITPASSVDTSYGHVAIGADGTVYTTRQTVTVDVVSGGGTTFSDSLTQACAIVTLGSECQPLPHDLSGISDLTIGAVTPFEASGAWGAASGNGGFSQPGSAPGTQWARQFSPVLQVNGDDGFFPVAADWMWKLKDQFGDPSTLCNGGPGNQEVCTYPFSVNTLLAPNEGAGFRVKYPNQNTEQKQEAVINGTLRAAHFSGPQPQLDVPWVYYFIDGAQPNGDRTIEFWYYYTFNYFSGQPVSCDAYPCGSDLHDLHEGDWEHVDVTVAPGNHLLLASDPAGYLFSEHDDPWRPSPGEPVLLQGTHVDAYSALGDHANYPRCTFGTQVHSEAGELLTILNGDKDYPCDAATDATHRVIAPDVVRGTDRGTVLWDLGTLPVERKFACWLGLMGDQHPGGLLGKIFGTSPQPPLTQEEGPNGVQAASLKCYAAQSYDR